MTGSVQLPKFKYAEPCGIAMYGLRKAMSGGRIVTHGLRLEFLPGGDPGDYLLPIGRVNCRVAITMESDRRLCAPQDAAIFNVSSSAHSCEGGCDVVSRTACKAGMHTDGSIEVRINLSHDRRCRTSCR